MLGLIERQQQRDAPFWREWAMHALAVLGGAHFLAGVVFFFAYNWEDLSAFNKFAILQFGILVAFAGALWFRLEHPAGQALLIVASVFTGVLLAVIGQVYQTGADAWELFAAWTVLILPWSLAARSNAHWLLWIIVCLVAVSLYGEQRLVALGRVEWFTVATVVGVLPIVFLGVRELALRAGMTWLDADWFRRGLAVISLGLLFVPAMQFVFDWDKAAPGFVAFLFVSAALAYVYTQKLHDFPVLSIVVAFCTLVGMAIGGRLIFEMLDSGEAGSLTFGLLLLAGWCVLLTSGAVRVLRHQHPLLAPGGNDG